MQTRENPPYKGGCPKIGLDRRGGMNQYPPNPGVALGRPSSLGWPLWIGLSHCPRMLTRDHGGTGHQVWLPARGGDEEVSSPPNGLKLTSAGERRTKALRGPRQSRHQGQSWWNQRVQTRHACSTWWCLSLRA